MTETGLSLSKQWCAPWSLGGCEIANAPFPPISAAGRRRRPRGADSNRVNSRLESAPLGLRRRPAAEIGGNGALAISQPPKLQGAHHCFESERPVSVMRKPVTFD